MGRWSWTQNFCVRKMARQDFPPLSPMYIGPACACLGGGVGLLARCVAEPEVPIARHIVKNGYLALVGLP